MLARRRYIRQLVFALRSSVMVCAVELPIHVRNLTKVFRVHEREEGMLATLHSLFRRTFKDVPAVQDVSFEIAEGEGVGFLGPNGAGKTTTLKMLSGLLYPPSGDVRGLGHVPSPRRRPMLSSVTLVQV